MASMAYYCQYVTLSVACVSEIGPWRWEFKSDPDLSISWQKLGSVEQTISVGLVYN